VCVRKGKATNRPCTECTTSHSSDQRHALLEKDLDGELVSNVGGGLVTVGARKQTPDNR